jgi:hypothetical protein
MAISFISQADIPAGEEIRGIDIRSGVFDLIQESFPDFTVNDCISLAELNTYRRLYLTSLIVQEKGELASIDQDVMDAIKNNADILMYYFTVTLK